MVRTEHGRCATLAGRHRLRLPAALLLLAASLAGMADVVHAQRVVITLDASPREVTVGGTVQVRVEAEADVDTSTSMAVELTVPDGFHTVAREIQRPVAIRVGPGGRRVTQRYVEWRMLRAEQPGRWVIGPAVAYLPGRSVRSGTSTVRVVSAGPGTVGGAVDASVADAASDAGSSDAAGTRAVQTADAARFDEQAFLRTVASVPRPYVGQPVVVSVYLYARGPLRASPVIRREPSTDGFWVQDLLPPSRQLRATRQVVRGRPYYVYELRRFVAQPLRAGEATIGAPQVEVRIGGDPFDVFDFFQGGGRGGPLVRDGQPLRLRVRALPDPSRGQVPVGRFGATLEARPRRLAGPGEMALVVLEVRGEAHPGDLEPMLALPAGLRLGSRNVHDEVHTVGGRLEVVRRTDWSVVAERAGRYELGPVAFDVFDPERETYVRVESGRAVLEVGSAGTAPSQGPAPATADDATERGDVAAAEDPLEGLGPWPPAPARWVAERRGPEAVHAWVLGALGLLLALGIAWRPARAASASAGPLRELSASLRRLARDEGAGPTDWLASAERWLLDLGGTLLGGSARGLSYDAMASALKDRIGAAAAEELVQLLRRVEELRFGGAAEGPDWKEARRQLLDGMEKLLAAARRRAPAAQERSRVAAATVLLLGSLAGTMAASAEGASSHSDALPARWETARRAYEDGRHEEARVLLEELAALAPRLAEPWHALGLAEARLGRLGSARAALLRAQRIAPRSAATIDDLQRVVDALARRGSADLELLGGWDWGRPWPPLDGPTWRWTLLAGQAALLLLGLWLAWRWRRAAARPGLRFVLVATGYVAMTTGLVVAAMSVAPYAPEDSGVVAEASRLSAQPVGPLDDGGDGAEDLAEGVPVRILDRQPGWWWVERLDGLRGWVPAERIRSLRPEAPWRPAAPAEPLGIPPAADSEGG